MNNIQKAFKAKRDLGLRMAVGGVLDQSLTEGSAVARLEGKGQLFDPNAPLSTGSRDLDTLGTAQGSAPQFALKSFSELSSGNDFYRAGSANDPKASASLIANPKPMQAPMQRPSPVQTAGFVTPELNGAASLKQAFRPGMADGGNVAQAIQNRRELGQVANYDAPAPVAAAPAPVAAPVAPSQAGDYAAQAAALEAQQLQAAQARQAAQKPKGFMARFGLRDGGIVSNPNRPNPHEIARKFVGDNLAPVVDSLPYAAAQFVPGLNVPLGLAAGAVHAAQGRTEELPLDAASMVPGGKQGVMLAKGAQKAFKIGVGNIGRTANGAQTLDASDAFGSPAYKQGGIVTDGSKRNVDDVDVTLAKDEAVLPSKTVDALGGPDVVRNIIETTNGKPTVGGGLREGGHYQYGGGVPLMTPDEAARAAAKAAKVTPVTPVPAAVPAPAVEGISVGDATGKAYNQAKIDEMRANINTAANGPATTTAQPTLSSTERVAASRAADMANAEKVLAAQHTAPTAAPAQAAASGPSRIAQLRSAINPPGATSFGDIAQKAKNVPAKGAGAGMSLIRAGSVGAGLEGAARGLNTTDAEYAQRLGIDDPSDPNAEEGEHGFGDWAKSMAVRVPGVLSDVGASAINAGALPFNLLKHGINFDKWYDYRNNFDDVKAAKAAQTAIPASSAKPVSVPGTPAATTAPVTAQPAVPTQEQIAANNEDADKTLAFAQRLGGIQQGAGDAGINAKTMLNSIANDAGVRNAMQASHDQRGDGVKVGVTKGADGRNQASFSGNYEAKPDLDRVNDANGNDTRQTTQLKASLRDAQRSRFLSEATATNPAYHERGRTGLAAMLAEDQVSGTNRAKMYEGQIKELELGNTMKQQTIENSRKDSENARSEREAQNKSVNQMLDDAAFNPETKQVDPDKQRLLRQYAAGIPRDNVKVNGVKRPMNDREHYDAIMDNFAVDSKLTTAGEHLSNSYRRTPWNGERLKWKAFPASVADRTVGGYPMHSQVFKPVDASGKPLDGFDRVIGEADLKTMLSPTQRALFNANLVK